ncbi:MAG: 4Fe-4S binding protein [Thermodesulfobacteriota bacterium]
MSGNSRILLNGFLLIALLVIGSLVSASLWGGKSEKLPEFQTITIQDEMTLAEFGRQNNVPNPILKKVFALTSTDDLGKNINDFGMSREEIKEKTKKALVLNAEEASKNWFKIPLKFAVWLVFLGLVFALMRKNLITPKTRKLLYLVSVTVFGIILGSDPSAMGTVKDAIHLYAVEGVIFPPRMIAFTLFLLTVLLANKYICSWGCQAGVLQDLIFRLGRNAQDAKGVVRQYKPSFLLTNSVRVLFLFTFTIAAVLWGLDIIDPVDPFKIYKPAVLTVSGLAFIAGLLILSLLVYRPWCHFFCPFGLVGWFVEKISLFKIKLNYETCIACGACEKACPSTVMGAILRRKRVIPDCFSCATCIGVCPTGSISFASGKRSRPPEGHFDRKKKEG